MLSLSDADSIFSQIYAETRSHYLASSVQLGAAALGFRILYGPPVLHAQYVFLGFQPGGRQDESNEGQHEGWPDQSWYAHSDAILARRLRYVFGIETIDHSGLNMIFFRAPNIQAWDGIEKKIRSDLEEFCLERVLRIIEALQPRHLVIIGLGTFERLTGTKGDTVLQIAQGARLAVRGKFGGFPTSGIVHLSGARVSSKNQFLLKELFNRST